MRHLMLSLLLLLLCSTCSLAAQHVVTSDSGGCSTGGTGDAWIVMLAGLALCVVVCRSHTTIMRSSSRHEIDGAIDLLKHFYPAEELEQVKDADRYVCVENSEAPLEEIAEHSFYKHGELIRMFKASVF